MNDDDLRRLLADARHEEPIPDDVAARLDDVLAGLADEGPVARPRVVDLDTQRRRRRVRGLLVAAVAVVLVGVGIGRLDLTRSSSDADSGSNQIAADSGGNAAMEDESSASAPSIQPYDRVEVGVRPLKVDDDDFADVAQEKALDRDLATLDSGVTGEAGGSMARTSWFRCERAPFGRGRLVAVEYAGNAAVLAVRPRTGDTVVVELLQCGTATVLRSATVPVP